MSDYASNYRPDLFAGKNILITGGGTGIGRCTAHELAHLGARVVIAARTEDALKSTAEEIRGDGGLCETQVIDITDDASVSDGVQSICDRVGPLHGLFNNAGGQFAAPAAKVVCPAIVNSPSTSCAARGARRATPARACRRAL